MGFLSTFIENTNHKIDYYDELSYQIKLADTKIRSLETKIKWLPEAYNSIDYSKSNCRNCGGNDYKDNKCKYCGTKH